MSQMFLKSKYISQQLIVGLFFLLGTFNYASAITTVPACGGGIYSVTDPTEYGFPGGLSKDLKGQWSSVPSGLTFSNPTVFKTIISGLVANTTYTVTWRSSINNKDFSFILQVGNNVASVGTIQFDNSGVWSTDDIVYCTGTNSPYTFQIAGANLSQYEFWQTDGSSGVSSIWHAKSTDKDAILSSYGSQDLIWGITTDASNNCQAYTTNSIRMAEMTAIEVKVVGGISVCGTTVPNGLQLQVMPYATPASGYTFQWRRDGVDIAGATSEFYTVNQFGSYDVYVKGCGTFFDTNDIDITNTVLPDVTILGDDICKYGDNSIITSTILPPSVVNYEWLYGGLTDASLGTAPSATVTDAGNYQLKIYSVENSIVNYDCYNVSNTQPIGFVDISATWSKANNATPFCANGVPSIQLDIINGVGPYILSISAGATIYPLTIGQAGVEGYSGVITLPSVSATTVYHVNSVFDATGCSPAVLPSDLTFNVEPSPSVLSVNYTGGCVDEPLNVSLTNAQANVTYTLRGPSGVISSIKLSSAGLLSFPVINAPVAAGTYYVTALGASTTCPEVTMANNIVVAAVLLDPVFSAGPICLGQGLTLNASETGVNYYLLRNGVRTGAFVSGTGGVISFGSLTLSGTYTVEAVKGSCTSLLSGSITVLEPPLVYALTANKYAYCQIGSNLSGVTLTLNGQQAGVVYQLQRLVGGVWTNYQGSQLGNTSGAPLNWNDVENGDYRVIATIQAGCVSYANLTNPGDPTIVDPQIIAHPLDVQILDLQDYYCADAGDVTIHGYPVLGVGSWFVDGVLTPTWFTDNADGTATFNVARGLDNSNERSYSFVYVYTDNQTGCTSQARQLTTFQRDLSTRLRFDGLPATMCQTDAKADDLIAYLDGVKLIGGTYSASPVAASIINNNVDPATGESDGTASFDPAVAGSGTHTVTFTYEDPVSHCTGTYTQTVQIGALLASNLNALYCVGENIDYILDGTHAIGTDVPSNSGGTWDIVGTTKNANSSLNIPNGDTWNPLNFSPDIYEFTYTYVVNGCTNTRTWDVELVEVADASFKVDGKSISPQIFCHSNTKEIVLNSSQPGYYTISYYDKVIDDWGTASIFNNINTTGENYFTPSLLAPGRYQIAHHINNPSLTTCSDKDIIEFEIVSPDISIDHLKDAYCDSEATTIIEGILDDGAIPATPAITGIFSSTTNSEGDPLIVDNPDGTATLNPGVGENPGGYKVWYTYTDPANLCMTIVERDVVIYETPHVNVTGLDAEYCTSADEVVLTANLPNVTINGVGEYTISSNPNPSDPSAFEDHNDGTATLRPQLFKILDNKSETFTVTYTFTTNPGGCKTVYSSDVTMKAAPVKYGLFGGGHICNGATTGLPIGLLGSEVGVTYVLMLEGTNVIESKAGTGLPITFTPQTKGGTYSVVATNNASSCSNEMANKVAIVVNEVWFASIDSVRSSCYGADDGKIVLKGVSSVSETLNYSIDNGISWNLSGVFTNVKPGKHQVTLRDEQGCTLPNPIDVWVGKPKDFEATKNPVGVSCFGGNDGSIVLTPDRSGVFEFRVNGGAWQSSPVFQNLIAGAYIVEMRDMATSDANYCEKTLFTIDIDQPDGIVIDLKSVKDVSCHNGNDGELEVKASGGTSVYSYQWYKRLPTGLLPLTDANTGHTAKATLLTAGIYFVEVIDNKNCSQSSVDFTISEPINVLTATTSVTNVSVVGGSDGVIYIDNITGGTPPYIIKWSDGSGLYDGLNLRNGLSAKTYSYTITDIKGCVFSGTVVVYDNNALTVSVSKSDVKCFDDATGSINVLVSNGVAPYEVTWNGTDYLGSAVNGNKTLIANGNVLIDPLKAGAYTVTVTDKNGGTVSQVVIIGQPGSPLVLDVADTDLKCYGDEDGKIVATVVGGTPMPVATYDFSINGGIINNDVSPQTYSDLSSGSYIISVANANGCTASRNVQIDQPKPIVVTGTLSHLKCHGDSNGAIVLHVTGGSGNFSYQWTSTPPLVFTFVDDIQQNQNNLVAGVYTVKVTDNNGCSSTQSFTITEPSAIVITGAVTDIVCNGNNNGKILLDVVGGTGSYTYKWSSGNGSGLIDGQQDQGSLTAGTYSVTVTDANLCTQTASYTITEPLALNFSLTVVDSNCAGKNSISITNSIGGSGNYTFTWSGPGVPAGTNASPPPTATNLSLSDLPGGDYTIVMTDAGVGQQCETSQTVSLIKPLAVTSVVVGETCDGSRDGKITLQVSEGLVPYSYVWTPVVAGNGLVANTKDQAGLSAGTYQVVVTDSRIPLPGCTRTLSVTVPLLNTLVLSESIKNVSCNGGSDGTIGLSVTGGSVSYTVEWTGPNGYASSNANLTGLEAGSYTVKVTDTGLNSCVTTQTYVVTQPPLALSLNASVTDVLCHGNATGEIKVTVAGGTSPYQYYWSGPGINSLNINSKDNPKVLIAGDYQLRVVDANLCEIPSGTLTIQEPSMALTLSLNELLNVTTVGGSNGAIEVYVSGGTGSYSYDWQDENGLSLNLKTARIDGIKAGRYKVKVIDDNKCTITSQIYIVTQPNQLLAVNLVDHKNIRPCRGSANGQIAVQITGGTPDMTSGSGTYLIEWYKDGVMLGNINDVNLTLNNLTAGSYRIRAKDANNVWAELTQNITEPTSLTVSANMNQTVSCNGLSDGQVTVNVSGGTPGTDAVKKYQITVSGVGVLQSQQTTGINTVFTGLPAGDYLVEVLDDADGNGTFSTAVGIEDDCRATAVVSVTQPNVLAVSLTATHVTCFGGNDGSITAFVSGGPTNGYLYSWYKDGVSYETGDNSINGLTIGTYRVDVESGSCSRSATYVVIQNNELKAASTITDVMSCYGDRTGKIVLTLSGGVAPYLVSYELDGQTHVQVVAGNVFEASSLPAGSYDFRVDDAKDCFIEVKNLVVSEPEQLTVSSLVSAMSCNPVNGNDGTLSFTISGGRVVAGVHSYVVVLSGSSGYLNTQTVPTAQPMSYSNLPVGDYVLTVRDNLSLNASKCEVTDQFTLQHIVISGDVSDASCKGINDGTIEVSVTGASSAYTFGWTTTDGLGLNTGTLSQAGLSAGTYTLTITDPNRSNCQVTKPFVVTNSKTLVINAMKNDVTCNGGNNGAVIVNSVSGATPAVNYYWNGSTIPGEAQLLNQPSGNVQLRVVDAKGCAVSGSYTINEPLAINFELSSTFTCTPYGRNISMSKLSGGDGSLSEFTYKYSGPGIATAQAASLSGMSGAGAVLLSGLTKGGTYSVTVYDRNLCSKTLSIDVYGEMQVTAVSGNLSCSGVKDGTIALNVSGGSGDYAFSWTKTGDASFTSVMQSMSGLSAGSYVCKVTDKKQICEKIISVTLTVPLPIVITGALTHLRCAGDSGGAIKLTVQGGVGPYEYTWALASGSGLVQGQKDQQGLIGGTYTVLVTDATQPDGCMATASFTIMEPAPLSFDLNMTNRTCAGIANLNVANVAGGTVGGTRRIDWAGPGITSAMQNKTSLTGLPAGVYTVRLVDVYNDVEQCSLSKTITIDKALTADYVTTPVSCSSKPDGTIDLMVDGGLGVLTYKWSSTDGGNLIDGVQDQIGLSAGTYRVLITDQQNCTVQLDIVVGLQSQIKILGTVIPVYCFGQTSGSINLNVTGASGSYIYQWTGAGVIVANEDQTKLGAGVYTVTVTDKVSGCAETAQFVIAGPVAPLAVKVESVTGNKCYGDYKGTIKVSVSGGSITYDYLWNGPANSHFVNGPEQSQLPAGEYYVTVKDASGCQVTSEKMIVAEPAQPLTISLVSITDVLSHGASTGAIQVTVNGGTASYTLKWTGKDWQNNPVTIADNNYHPINLPAGTYGVTVTDENGCQTALDPLIVQQPGDPLVLTATGTDIRPCNGDASGMIRAYVTGGALPYAFSVIDGTGAIIKNGVGNGFTADQLEPGLYRVEVVDGNDQVVSQNVTIAQPAAIVLTASVTNHVNCFGAATGSVNVSVTGGIANSGKYLLIVAGSDYYKSEEIVASAVSSHIKLKAGNYSVRVIDDSNGDKKYNINDDCWTETTLTIIQPEAIVKLNGDQAICTGEDAILEFVTTGWGDIIANPLTVKLSNGDNVTLNTSPYVYSYKPLVSELITIKEVSVNGCLKGTGIGESTVIVHERPSAKLTGNSVICQGESSPLKFYLTGQAPWRVVYSDGINQFTTPEIFTSPYELVVTPGTTQTYALVSVIDAHCTQAYNPLQLDNQATVNVNTRPTVVLAGDNIICEGESTNLSFALTGAAPWQIIYNENGIEKTIPNVMVSPYVMVVSPVVSTQYSLVEVSDLTGCKQAVSGSAYVKVNPLPGNPNAINGPLTVCQGQVGVVFSTAGVFNDPQNSYEWELPAGFTLVNGAGSTSIAVDVSDNAVAGLVKVSVKNGCGESVGISQFYVTVNRLPLKPGLIQGKASLCQGDTNITYQIDAVNYASEYEWFVPSGMIIREGQGTLSIKVDLDPSQYGITGSVRVKAKNSCGDGIISDPYAVTIHVLPQADAGDDANVCGTEYVMKAIDPGTDYVLNWRLLDGNGSATVVSPTLPNSMISKIAKGENVFEWTVTNSLTTCKASDRVTITNNLLMVSAAASNYELCSGEVTLLAATPSIGTSGLWTSSPLGAQFSSSVSGTTGVTNLAPGLNIMRWTITKEGCDSYAEVNVINNEPSEAVVVGYTIPTQTEVAYTGVPIWVCGDAVTLRAKAINFGRGDGKWTVIKGAGVIATSTSLQTNITELGIGENIFRWSVALDGCVKSVDVIVRNNQLVVSAGKDQATCLDQVTIAGTPLPSPSIVGYWYVAKDNVSGLELGRASFSNGSNFTTTVSNLASDDNYLVWSLNQNGCISTDTVKITNNQPTKAIIPGSNENICRYQFDLVANKPIEGNGYWSIPVGSGRFDDKFDESTTVRDIDKGLNTFRWNINKNGCSSYADIVVNNLKVNVFAGRDSVVCRNQITLNSTPATVGVGEWSIFTGGATIFESNNPKSMATLSAGSNQLIWSINNSGCLSSDTVTFINNTVVADAGGDQPDLLVISTVMNAVLKDKIKESGIWSVISGRGEFVNPISEDSRVNNIQAGENVYKWTVTRGGCVDDDLVVITNSGGIIADAGVPQTVCNNEAELHANDPETGVGFWSIAPGTGNGSGVFVDYTSSKTRVTGLSPGRNLLRWTVAYPSGSTYSDVEITNNAVPEITAGGDLVTCSDTHTLEGTQVTSDFTIEWLVLSGGGGFNDRTIFNPVITGLAKGNNLLQMKVSKGVCFRTAMVTITNDQPDVPRAGDDKTLCTDSVLLSPNTPLFGVGEWQTEGATTAIFNGNWAKNLSSGPNTFAWVIRTTNCELRDLVTITNNKPSLANAGQSVPVCVDSILLMANPPATGETGLWSTVVSGGVIANLNNPSTMVNGLSKGSNVFRWTIDNHGCKSTSDVAISYDFLEAIAGDPQSSCVDYAVLRANNPSPGVGSWGVLAGSSSVTIDDINLSNTTVRDLDQGLNTLIWTIRNGACVDTSHVIIRNNKPTTANAGNDFPTCDSEVSLSANIPQDGAGTGRWELLSGGGGFADVNNAKTRISGLGSGKNLLRWTIENNGCYSFDDVEVSYNMIFATVGPDQMDNCSSSAQLEANNPSPGVGTWSVIGGSSRASFVDIHDPNSIVSNLGYGVNTLRWTIVNAGCESPAAEVKVVNNSPSPSYAGNNDAICKDSTNLDATIPYPGIGTWEVLTGGAVIDASGDAKTIVRGLSRGDNVFRWTVRNGTCFNSDEVLIVNNRPSDPYAGEDMEICILEQQLKANPPEYGQGVWTIPTGSATIDDPESSTTLATTIGYGRNVFRWTITRGQCSLFDEVVVVNNTASTALAGPDVQDCKNYALMDANVPEHGTGNWSLVSGNGSFGSITDSKTQVSGLNFGENIFLWTITNGSCFSTDQVTIFNKVPDQADAGGDKTICDSYLTMYGNPANSGIGKWTVLSGAGDFVDSGAYNTVVNNVGFGENVFQWKITYGSCSTEDVVTVVNNRAYPDAGEDAIVYQPSHVLNALNPGTKVTGVWSVMAGNGVFGDNTFFNTQVTDLAEGVNTFSWTIDVNGCVVSDDVSVTFKVVPDAGFINDVSAGCYPLTVRFTNYTVGGNSYFWDFGDGEVSVDRNPVHTFERAGNFRVSLTVPGPDGKDGVYTSFILVHDHPVVSFTVSPSLVYVPGDEIRAYNASTGGSTYLWRFGDGATSSDQHPQYGYLSEGVFDVSLTVTNEFGCADSMVIEDAVTAILQGFIAFPNAFLPRPGEAVMANAGQATGDAVFAPKYRDVDQYHLQIFDRWGQMIFESNDISIGWDGMYKEQLSPQDVYVYKSWGRFVSGREFQKTGSVLLVR